jgi:multiple sugar transport system permease protein
LIVRRETAGSGGGGPRLRLGRAGARERWFYLLASPWILGFLLLQAIPLALALGLAFTDWEPPAAPRLVGLDNFAALVADARFVTALANTVVYALATVVPGLVIGLALALLLAPLRRGGGAIRTVVFMPVVVAGAATALMWGWILNPRFGLVNGLLASLGVEGPGWLHDRDWAMAGLVIMGLWNVGVNVVVYLAALRIVPSDLHEAAALDGAGAWRRFRAVTWPALTPVTFYLAVVNAIGASQVFTPTYLLTSGGPEDRTLTTALYTYETAFRTGELGYAAAMTLAVFALLVLVTAGQFRALGGRVQHLAGDS